MGAAAAFAAGKHEVPKGINAAELLKVGKLFGCVWQVLSVATVSAAQHLWLELRTPALAVPQGFKAPGGDTVINVGATASVEEPEAKIVPGPKKPLLPTMAWACMTFIGLLYMAAMICLCTYPVVRSTVQLAGATNMVRLDNLFSAHLSGLYAQHY